MSLDDTYYMSDHPIKRVSVVYGKRSNHIPLSLLADEQEQSDRVLRTRSQSPQHRLSSPSPSIHAPNTEHPRTPDATFQFGFRHRLKELDEQFDNHDATPSRSSPPSMQSNKSVLCQAKDIQSVSMDTTILACSVSKDPPRALQSPSSVPSCATTAQEKPPEGLLGRRRARGVQILISSDDSEVEGPSNSSSVSPVRHAITTPHSRSSPTPPTSGEVPMTSRKGKGKIPSRDALPLLFEDGQHPVAKLTKRGRQSDSLSRPKTKAPTKKELREAAFESSRIAANRPVEVVRSQEQKHSLSAFFASLRRDNIATITPSTELLSDPIERFSSPTDNPILPLPQNTMLGAPTELLRTSMPTGTSNQLLSSKDGGAFLPAVGDSDDEMSSATSLIQVKNEKLQKIKRGILQYNDANDTFGIDSEDDLLVVKDDMHVVAREEAAQRRINRARGSPAKDITSLRRINHPSIHPAAISPQKLSRQVLEELAKPSFVRTGKSAKGQLNKRQLDQLIMKQHTQEQLESIKRHEEEWVGRGGRLSRDAGNHSAQVSLSQKLGVYAEQGLKAAVDDNVVEGEVSVDESDEDYVLDVRCPANPGSMARDEDEAGPDEVSGIPQPLVGDDEDEGQLVPLGRTKPGQRHHRIVVGSDDEGEQPVDRNLPTAQRDSTSSMESQTEDENDKENSAKLMYDRSEDKENKATVRHEPSSAELFGSRSLSFASTTISPKETIRSPLKDISKDEDDLFLSPTPSKSSFSGRLHDATKSSPCASVSVLSLGSPSVLRSERTSRINRLSLNPGNNENDLSCSKLPQPSFLERLRNESLKPSLAVVNPLHNGGFSQLFSVDDRSSKEPTEREEVKGLSLTLDVGLKPALEVNETQRQKAEIIFEKEQEYIVVAAVKQNDKPKEPLYVNDHGFLTQTYPEGSSSQVYRMAPSQASKFNGTQVYSAQTQLLGTRPPLRMLPFTVSQDLSPGPQPLRRLRKRSSPSPLGQKTLDPDAKLNVFNILGEVTNPPPKIQKEKYEKSEFVAVEAEESDEDDMVGFGGPKRDEEDDDDEQDKVVEGLVDDTTMDAETEAAHLVQEKYREHEEEDDQQLQKLHQDAVEGKLRMKRRVRGVGLADDSDDDDDEDARRIRQRMPKRRKIESDSLEALGQNEETRAFYNTYHQDLIDEDEEFQHLRGDMAVLADDYDVRAEQPEERETVSVDEVRQRVRDLAQNNHEVEVLDPKDTSWIDQSMMIEADEVMPVKMVGHGSGKSTTRHPNVRQMDFDEERPKGHVESEQERRQMKCWARNHQSSRYQGTGRSGNSAAVTGHTIAKPGGGTLRSVRHTNPVDVGELPKRKTSSLLSTVSNRRGRFA